MDKILKQIDKEVERCESLITRQTYEAWINRIQGLLYVRRLIEDYKQK